MNDEHWTEEYWHCIERSFDETASPDELLDFEEFLQNNPEAQRKYLHEMQLQAELHLLMHSRRNLGTVLSQVAAQSPRPASSPIAPVIAPSTLSETQQPILASIRNILFRGTGAMSRAAAALLIGSMCFAALVTVAITMAVMKTPAHAQPVVLPVYVAQLSAAHNLKWANAASSPMVDQLLAEGQNLQIASGWAEITFKDGARVVLEGPASLELQSPAGARLNAGKLALETSAPSAKFIVHTPTSRIVDLGSEFGVHVEREDIAIVEVFAGAVDVHAVIDEAAGDIGSPERLTKGQSLRAEKHSQYPSSSPVLHRSTGTQHQFVRTVRPKNHTLGSSCIGRVTCDTAEGSVVLKRSPTTQTGRATSFSFYNVHNDNNRWITPVILAFDQGTETYRVTGIGQSVLNLGTGQQTVPFQLIVGSGDLQAGIHTFGFYHGTVDKTGKATSASLGPLDYDRILKPEQRIGANAGHVNPPDSEGRWIFTPKPATPVPLCLGLELNASPTGGQVLLSTNCTTFLDVERVYSGRLEIVAQPEFPPTDSSANVSQFR